MNRYKQGLIFLLVLLGSKGNLIAISDYTLVFTFIYAAIGFQQTNQRIPSSVFYILIGYIALTSFYYINFGWINYWSSLRFIIRVFTGIFSVLILREELFSRFEKLIILCAKISIFFFAFQLISYSGLKFLVGLPENTIPGLDYRGSWYVNNLLFTLNDNAQFRNSGIAWEPKGFANLLVIAIVINLLRHRFSLNKGLYILFLATISTFSTTAFIILFSLIPAIFIVNFRSEYKGIFLALSLIFGAIIFNLELVGDKIFKEVEEREAHFVYLEMETDQKAISLGRFGSMQMALMDLPKNPVFGIGMQDKYRTDSEFTHLVYVNGIADFLSRFGIAGIVFMFFCYYKSAKRYFERMRVKGSIYFFLAMMIIFFASAIIINPLYFAFQFYFLIPTYKPIVRKRFNFSHIDHFKQIKRNSL
jgi:hypothetical protein